MLSQAVNSVVDNASIIGQNDYVKSGNRRTGGTVISAAVTLDTVRNLPRNTKKAETIHRFDAGEKRKEEVKQPTSRQKEREPVEIEMPSEKGKKGSGRFKKKEFVDQRNELMKNHAENLSRAQLVREKAGLEPSFA